MKSLRLALFAALTFAVLLTPASAQSHPQPDASATASQSSIAPPPEVAQSTVPQLDQADYEHPCPSKTKWYEDDGGPYVTEPFTLGATANMSEYCHNVYHDICTGEMLFYVYSKGAWNELGADTHAGECAWQLTTSAFSAGNQRLKAVYTDDQDGFGSSSALVTLNVQKWPTTTTLTSSQDPSIYKQDVTFTATAVPDPNAPATPTGKIKFSDGSKVLGTVVVDANGIATLTTQNLPAGMDPITAQYLGDSDNAASTSPVLIQVVNPADEETSPASSAGGASAGLSARASDAPAVAKPQPQSSPAYTCRTTTTLSTSGSPSMTTHDVTFTSLSSQGPTCKGQQNYGCNGEVVFYNDHQQIGSANLNVGCAASMDTTSLSAGTHHISATFYPERPWNRSSAELTQVIDKWPTASSLTSTPNPSSDKQEVTFTANVTSPQVGPLPAGKVKFLDGAKSLGAASVDANGNATITTKRLAVGTDSITSEYLGDGNNLTSQAALQQVVNP